MKHHQGCDCPDCDFRVNREPDELTKINLQLRRDLADMVDKIGELEDENLQLSQNLADLQEVLDDKRRLTRELDIAINGEEGAAKQASLCDLIVPVKRMRQDLADAVEEWGKCLFPDMPHHTKRYQDFLKRPSVRALIKEQP